MFSHDGFGRAACPHIVRCNYSLLGKQQCSGVRPSCFSASPVISSTGFSVLAYQNIGVKKPEIYKKSWDQAFTVYTWYVEQDEEKNETVFYVNFQGKNPNEETVEINVRENCFYPSKEGIGYITLSGFVVKQAATQWAPPTAYQEGMVGPHWSKGWISPTNGTSTVTFLEIAAVSISI